VGIICYLARVQLETPDLQLVDAPAHFIKVRIARIIGLMCDGIIIPVVEHCLRGAIAEIAEAQGTPTYMKEHQSVDIRNILGDERMYGAYAET